MSEVALTAEESTLLETALIFLKHGEVDLARRCLAAPRMMIEQRRALSEDIQKVIDRASSDQCPFCRGSGEVRTYIRGGVVGDFNPNPDLETCRTCGGTGRLAKNLADQCAVNREARQSRS